MRKSLQLLALSVVAGALLSGCGGGGSAPPPDGNGTGNPLPSVTSLSPASATAGGAAFTLTVTGSNFVSGTVVNWAGTALTTTFVSSSSVTAAVPATDLSIAGTVQVIVTNPTPGGGGSAAKTFSVNNPAPTVTSLSQTAANVGSGDFILTVTGSGFVSLSVVNWNGSARPTTFGSGTQLTANISASDLAIAGSAHVSVSNPTPGGGGSGNITFTITPHIANGTSLPGSSGDLAINATTDLRDTAADGNDIEDNVVMTRLDVRFAQDATVDQVNNALGSIGAGIVSMSQGLTSMTIGVPRQPSVDALQALVDQLNTSPGVSRAKIADVINNEAIFIPADFDLPSMALQVRHLLPGRFPAAWNIVNIAQQGDPGTDVSGTCPTNPVPVFVTDEFKLPTTVEFLNLFGNVHTPDPLPPNPPKTLNLSHGYVVSQTLGANAFGANPFSRSSGCVDLHLVQVFRSGFTPNQAIDAQVDSMPAAGTKFIMNASMGYAGCETSPCTAPQGRLRRVVSRADDALYWKQKTHDRWGDFLFVVAAGNERSGDDANIYPGTRAAAFDYWANIAQRSDTTFSFVTDDSLWTPSSANQTRGFTSLKGSAADALKLSQDVTAANLQGSGAVEDNVIVVGSVSNQTSGTELTQHFTGEQLTESTFSNSNPDVFAVGEDVLHDNGTSVAAPQVAGLASYLWMLSPDLRGLPSSITKRTILSNTRNNKLIDAYATVLALDGTTFSKTTMPMRFALLDVNHDGVFDNDDLDEILSHLFVTNANDITLTPIATNTTDFSRYDLNGDGFTTAGARRERFDLDRVGSVQFGATNYSNDVHETIEGQDIHFDENSLTDIQILCYYAYSPLYTGDSDARKNLMSGRCGISVLPTTATVKTGGQVQFSVSVPNNDTVAWTITGAGNSITSTGLATAGNTTGTFTVTATDINSTNLSATATLTVTNKSVDCAAVLSRFQNSDGLEVRVGVDDTEGPDRTTTTESTLTDSMSNGKASASATASYPSLTASVDSSDTDGNGAGARLEFSDVIVIVPNDPALVGTTATLTETYHFSSTGSVSGANAQADVTISPPDDAATTGTHVLSTQPQHSRGNINVQDEAFTGVKGDVILGDALGLSGFMTMNAELTCNENNPTSDCDRTGTGTASESATLTLHDLIVTDQGGNSIGFSVCSVSGFTYGH